MTKILMIDDDADVTMAMQTLLEANGYQFFSARNSAEGLRRLKELEPDLIILDVMMDTATEGFQTALTLRSAAPDSEYAAYRDTPILMLTSVHDTTTLRFAPDDDYLPVDAFVDKSADPDEVLAQVRALLG